MSAIGPETLRDVRNWSGDPPGCSGVVGRPSQMSGSGREALPDVWEESGDPSNGWGSFPGCPEVLGGPPKCPEVVGRPS